MMQATPVIAIFDVGKTNKKLFLFNEQYQVVLERSVELKETTDEEGDPCENLESLRLWVLDSLQDVCCKKEYSIQAVNFSTYGASLVYIDKSGRPVAPLYNYLKPYPVNLQKQFYETYGGEEVLSFQTATPALGSLNAGLQLYRIKYEQPELFQQIRYALHLPQYLGYLLSGHPCADITSIGCHTALWDFSSHDYHGWVYGERIHQKLAPLAPCDRVVSAASPTNHYKVGTGLHDSSAALIPYQVSFEEPFVLLSTGTWCISINPFNETPLTREELQQDCLCYMQYRGKPVKASRLFAGQAHEDAVKRIAVHFQQDPMRYKDMEFNAAIIACLQQKEESPLQKNDWKPSVYFQRDLSQFASDEEAYHQLIMDLVAQQYKSTSMVIKSSSVKRIFVDGGFSKNRIYMNLLAATFPQVEVFAAVMAQATALGTAMAIHPAWNKLHMPENIISLNSYSGRAEIVS